MCLKISKTEMKRASTSGPIIKPINPKSFMPPKTLNKTARVGIFVLPLIMIGLNTLSTILMTSTP